MWLWIQWKYPKSLHMCVDWYHPGTWGWGNLTCCKVLFSFWTTSGFVDLIQVLELFFSPNFKTSEHPGERGLLDYVQEYDCCHQSFSIICLLPLSLDTVRAWLGRSTVVSQLLLPSSPDIPLHPTVPCCERKNTSAMYKAVLSSFLGFISQTVWEPGKVTDSLLSLFASPEVWGP